MITEGVMQQGSFSITLKPETPLSIALPMIKMGEEVAHSQIIVTESWVPPEQIHALMEDALYDYTAQPGTIFPEDDNPLPYDAGPRYTGVLHQCKSSVDGGLELSGYGLQSLLGDSERGQFIYRRVSLDVGDPPGVEGGDLFNYALDGFDVNGDLWDYDPSPLRRRYYFVSDLFPESQLFGDDVAGYIPRMSLLEMIAVRWVIEWVIRPHGRVDMGNVDQLYPGTPPVITRLGGDDRTDDGAVRQGLTVKDLSVDVDVDDWASQVLLITGDGAVASATSPLGWDMFGREIELQLLIDRSDVTPASAFSYAQAERVKVETPHREISVSTATHEGLDRVVCGQRVLIHDPAQGLVGSEFILHRGEWISPYPTRVVGHTWPLRPGMGVYRRRYSAGTPAGSVLPPIPPAEDFEVVDLTPYVEFEEGDATIVVGDPQRPAFPKSSAAPTPLEPSDAVLSPEGQGHVATQTRLLGVEAVAEAANTRTSEDIETLFDPTGTLTPPFTQAQVNQAIYDERNAP